MLNIPLLIWMIQKKFYKRKLSAVSCCHVQFSLQSKQTKAENHLIFPGTTEHQLFFSYNYNPQLDCAALWLVLLVFCCYCALEKLKVSLWQITVSGHSNFGTYQTNSVSYESWYLELKFETSLRLLRLILWPQDVSEVTEVKMKKNWGENSRITNFWLKEM